tara:strand:+ start:86 stop:568 length:483 start_codon:yes stop_codon:yes gene_type:complete
MVYLLTANDLSPQTRRWLNNYAIKLSRDTWIHCVPIRGCVKATISIQTANEMQTLILRNAIPWMSQVHDMVMDDRLRRKDLRLIQNKLRMLHEILEAGNNDMEDVLLRLASYLDIFFKILGNGEPTLQPEESNENSSLLGVDKDSTQKYLLSLVKKETIH